jgi:AcrR family transcriptional regulator
VPRAGLTPARVVAAGADLADEIGYEQVTLAAIASRFGVAVPSLYKHVGGLEAVRRGIAVLAVRELGDALARGLAAAGSDDPGARLRAIAAAYRAYARTHPGRYAATVRAATPGDREHTAASDAVLQSVLGVLAERGLEGDEAVDATRGLRAALHGFVALEMAGGFGLPRDVERSYAALIETIDRGLPRAANRGAAERRHR